MPMAKLKSKDQDGRHSAPLEKVKVIRHEPEATIVETAVGIICKAQYNPFVGYYFADDVNEIVEN